MGNESSRDFPPDALRDADRQFFLGLYRSAVDFYKPRIEKRTGVQLGDIAVWDHARLHQHVIDDWLRRAGALRRFLWAIVFRRRQRRYARSLEETYAKMAHERGASYFQDAVYVSFDSGTPHEEFVAMATVHELSHALWEMIASRGWTAKLKRFFLIGSKRLNPQELEKYELLSEGFATYAERVWFTDLYPPCVRALLPHVRLKPGSVYARGLRRIQELVRDHGPQIVMEIPKRWRRL